MPISSKIIKDSISDAKVRLTTYVLVYQRFIHSEVMTHRAMSRNASSSRAIPFVKQMKAIMDEMAMPISFLSNKPGMQGGERLSRNKETLAFLVWKLAGYSAVFFAKLLHKLGVHKQYVNRVIEPFSFITLVITATDENWAHFFALRYHPDAQPEIAELAKQMYLQYSSNVPQFLPVGSWHLPFVDTAPISPGEGYDWRPFLIRSVAACARTSYNNHDGSKTTIEKDLRLYNDLKYGNPMHSSPFEHQACAQAKNMKYEHSGNLPGWIQYRKLIPGEFVSKFDKPLKNFW